MSTSKKKVAANRINGRKSHGPKDTTSTRFNATKHGLLAAGITELDDQGGYRTLLDNLKKEKQPVGVLELLFVESAALDIVRWRRARRLEAEYITAVLNPMTRAPESLRLDGLFEGAILDPGLPAVIDYEPAQRLVSIYQRYESVFALRLFRTLHELERLHRMRRGEKLQAPAVEDVSIDVSASGLLETLEKSADTGTVDSVSEALEQPKATPSDEE